jgi:hypothetical protein
MKAQANPVKVTITDDDSALEGIPMDEAQVVRVTQHFKQYVAFSDYLLSLFLDHQLLAADHNVGWWCVLCWWICDGDGAHRVSGKSSRIDIALFQRAFEKSRRHIPALRT